MVLECVSGSREMMPPPGSGLAIPPALTAIQDANPVRLPGHILTGPVAVRGAEPGDMLEVRIDAIELGADWGFCGHRPLAGTLGHRAEARAVLRRDGGGAEARVWCDSDPRAARAWRQPRQ
ncbi:MAG: hypothetical protein NVS2B11_01460 [Acetobacteraceae bacterium]